MLYICRWSLLSAGTSTRDWAPARVKVCGRGSNMTGVSPEVSLVCTTRWRWNYRAWPITTQPTSILIRRVSTCSLCLNLEGIFIWPLYYSIVFIIAGIVSFWFFSGSESFPCFFFCTYITVVLCAWNSEDITLGKGQLPFVGSLITAIRPTYLKNHT